MARFINTEDIKTGMVLARTIATKEGKALIFNGSELRASSIDTIRNAGIAKVIIVTNSPNSVIDNPEESDGSELDYDILPKEIQPETEIINEAFREKTVSKIKNFMSKPVSELSDSEVRDYTNDIARSMDQVVDSVLTNQDAVFNLTSLKNYDDYTFQHSMNVAVIASALGAGLRFNSNKLRTLVTGAVFHDIGKTMIDINIINKPSQLTDDEFAEIKKHPTFGYHFAKDRMHLPPDMLMCILQHHEYMDGSGYPLGCKSNQISLFAQIITVADIYDAITSKRSYHEAKLPSEVVEYIMGNATYRLSVPVVEVFVSKVAVYPVGTDVELSNGTKGYVSENFEGSTLRPMIKVTDGNDDREYIDLRQKENFNLTIVKCSLT
jgi:putative nucleotidyltransferase with HDIG domain